MNIETKTAQTLREYRQAYKQANGKQPNIIERGGTIYVNNEPMTTSQLKVATAKMQAKNGTFAPTSETPDERKELIEAIDAGNAGNLIIGKVLHKRFEKGRMNLDHLKAWLRTQGRKLPEKSARSKFVGAYEAWVRNAKLDLNESYTHPDFTDDAGNPIPMTLKGVSTYALYEARNLINRESPVETLALVFNNTIEQIKDLASDDKNDRKVGEGVRSLPKVPEAVHDMFKNLVETHFPGKSKLEVVEFAIQFLSDLAESSPETFETAVNGYFGEEGSD